MNKINLYNQDGSLHPEAQLLLSSKPDDMSAKEWRKRIREFKFLLSKEDLKEFEKLKKKSTRAKWRVENPEKVKAQNAKWRAKNPEKVNENSAKWNAENPEKAKACSTNWRATNPDYINNYQKQRKSKDPLYRLQCNMRTMGNRVVKQLSIGKKPACTEKWQGCTAEELKTYLESIFTEGMTWKNYGEWHVDHIRPVCSFSAEEWEQINHYTNLRPLWAEDNIAKSISDKKQKRIL
jgi:hypothetical protein